MAALRRGWRRARSTPSPCALAHVIMGALDEAALYIAEADDEVSARAEVEQVLGRMIDSLRPAGRK